MRIGKVAKFITVSYQDEALRHRSLFFKGASGIGKSAAVHQASEALSSKVDNWQGVVDIRLSQCDPTDLRGVPEPRNGRTTWNVPDIFPAEGTSGILFLDEITSAPAAIQAAAYQLVLDRRIGDYRLPDGWMVVAAGNLVSDRGVTFTMASPLLNRMTEILVETVLEDWVSHAASKGIRPEVLAFVSNRADYLHRFEGKSEQFPSPRGWFAVSDHMNLDFDLLANRPEEAVAMRVEVIKGDVGHAAASDFEAFLRVWESMPSIDKIEEDPDSVEVPDRLDVQYCLTMGIAARLDARNFANFWSFLKRMPKEKGTLAVKLAYKRDKSLVKSPAFNEWALANQDAFKRG